MIYMRKVWNIILSHRQNDCMKLKKDQIVNFKIPGENDTREAIILGRAGKATTVKKSWYNIEYNQPENMRGDQISIDLRTVNDLKVVNQSDDLNEDVLLSDIDFTEAREAELDNWRKHNVYEEVEDNGQNCISTRWVYTMKELENEFHRKARLVAKGFEEDSLDEIPKNSPTCEKQSLRLILSIIASKRWSINSVDIKTAFLQGEKMQREWYEKVKATLLDCGGTVSKIDSAVFYWYNEKGLTGVLAVHVDDFLWAGSSTFEKSVVSRIRDMFKVGKESCESFKYLGLDLSQENETIVLSQQDYVRMLKTVLIDKDRVKTSPLSSSEQTLLRSKIGQLLWLARQTRPDIAFDVAAISSKIKSSTIEDLKKVNKIIRKVQNDPVSLQFQNLGHNMVEVRVVMLCFLMGDDGKVNPITWQSKKLRRVVRSTLASEALALADGVDCVLSLAALFKELMHNENDLMHTPVDCFVDNKDLYHAIYSDKPVGEKRLRVEINAIKQLLQGGELKKVNWIQTNEQIANVLTKHGASGQDILRCFEKGLLNSSLL
ncbi:Hypothetical predicted protein [Mytilus galloprovincialis]|uniref:Reverse transcriptase Ty1/copia-type domain-containing protein n=1 Tax=Mytilus galloprovincialis TaxID=29158 RepID=A0A8B6DP79_MYTGA|nr:Hypothetical predicted protein [Mytilus galloprovincialis]